MNDADVDTDAGPGLDPLAVLWDPATTRLRCAAITQAVDDGLSSWFTINREALPQLARDCAARWRGFKPHDTHYSLWSLLNVHVPEALRALDERLKARSAQEAAQARVDLCVIAALLSDDAGPDWAFDAHHQRSTPQLAMPAQRQRSDDLLAMLDQASGQAPAPAPMGASEMPIDVPIHAPTGAPPEPSAEPQFDSLARPPETPALADTESRAPRLAGAAGLALAVLRAFQEGVFSARADDALRVDARVLTQLDLAALRSVFQADGTGAAPLPGLQARVDTLRLLGASLEAQARRSGQPARPCALLSDIMALPEPGDAGAVMRLLASRLAPLEPHGCKVLGLPAGDVAVHRWAGAQTTEGPHRASAGFVPFHQRAGRLVLALAPPLRGLGVELQQLQSLAAGGDIYQGHVFLERGIVVPRDPRDLSTVKALDDECVSEWRALNVSLMDELARLARAELGLSDEACPSIAWAQDVELAPRAAPLFTIRAPRQDTPT